GTILDLQFQQPVDVGAVRSVTTAQGLGETVIQRDQADPRVVLVRTPPLGKEAREGLLAALDTQIGKFTVLRIEDVHGVIARNLIMQAVLAVIIAIIGILLYLAFRFEYRFGTAAVIALIHDVIIVIGAFALFRIEVGSAFVAAVLTILGYSVMDTVVVFDRIRENLKLRQKGQSYAEVANLSINQVVGRSIKTSLTVFFAVMAVLIFGGKTTRDFALALAVGVLSGTYSSIFIASPIWVWWKEREDRARRKALETTKGKLRPARPISRPAESGRPATRLAPDGRPATRPVPEGEQGRPAARPAPEGVQGRPVTPVSRKGAAKKGRRKRRK
ncbi:MAG TPA: protein translocase subunit SecF, partial [Firmicutes bacterium]|nr:protein translocase subunit SecF [Bacillota bacterium]